MTRTCGECGFTARAGKRWRIKGRWVRCPRCVASWATATAEHARLDDEAAQR